MINDHRILSKLTILTRDLVLLIACALKGEREEQPNPLAKDAESHVQSQKKPHLHPSDD